MEKLQRLLDEVRLILKKAEVEKKEADRRGESFNIFNVLGVTSDETRTHSAFIAELLDPMAVTASEINFSDHSSIQLIV